MSWIDDFVNEVFEPIEEFSIKLDYLYSLLESSTLDTEQREDYEYHIAEVSNKQEFRECIYYLMQNQQPKQWNARSLTTKDFKQWMSEINPKPQ